MEEESEMPAKKKVVEQVTEECPECEGSGTIECLDCSGTGEVDKVED